MIALAWHGAADEAGALAASAGRLEAPARFAGRPWHAATSPCPFVGPLAGYVVVAADTPPAQVAALARAGRGVVADVDADAAWSAIELRRFSLADVLAPGGLAAGEALLSLAPDSAYAADVLDRVERALAAAGLTARLGWGGAANPVHAFRLQPVGSDQLYPPAWSAGGGVRDLVDPLRGLSVELWTFAARLCG